MKKFALFIITFSFIVTSCNHINDENIKNTFVDNTIYYEEETETLEETTTNNDTSNLSAYFIDVGQADACLLESDGHFMLIDAGNNNDAELLLDFLKIHKVEKLDYVIGTHLHEDHIGSLDTIIENFDIGQIYLPNKLHTSKTFEDVLDAIEKKNLTITEPIAGNIFYFNEIPVEIIAPIKDYDDLNNNSIVLKIDNGDLSFLFTGDIEMEAEKDIIETEIDISADILKVAHHGSDTSSTKEFINRVSPDYTVISVGENNKYGHPSKAIIELFNSLGINIYRTDESGNIKIYRSKNKVNIDLSK